jgi:hypothetical protein
VDVGHVRDLLACHPRAKAVEEYAEFSFFRTELPGRNHYGIIGTDCGMRNQSKNVRVVLNQCVVVNVAMMVGLPSTGFVVCATRRFGLVYKEPWVPYDGSFVVVGVGFVSWQH